MDLQYINNAGANNGRVMQMNDLVSGADCGSGMGTGFWIRWVGNLLTKAPSNGDTGTTMALSVDPSIDYVTMSGFGYDLNGNMTTIPAVPQNIALGCDVENRTGSGWFDQQNQPWHRGGNPDYADQPVLCEYLWKVYEAGSVRRQHESTESEELSILRPQW
jgi:hypothetical protein